MDNTVVSHSIHDYRLATTLCAVPIIVWALIQYRKLSRRRSTPKGAPIEDLNNIPGPPAPSFISGSLADLYNLDGFGYQQKISEQCGSSCTCALVLG